jgi:DNA-binding phage protein
MKKHQTKHISKLKIPKVKKPNLEDFDEYESSIDFTDPIKLREMLLQHFIDGEHDTFFELLTLYIHHVGKTKISQKTKIPERTIYNFISGEHHTSSENVFKIMKFISQEIKKASA